MNTSSKNPSKEFTKNCIMDALLQLMHTKEYEQISISELTQKAGVSRMSYYRNYNCKDSILIDYMHRILKEYAEELKGPSFRSDFQTYDHILRSLKYLVPEKGQPLGNPPSGIGSIYALCNRISGKISSGKIRSLLLFRSSLQHFHALDRRRHERRHPGYRLYYI